MSSLATRDMSNKLIDCYGNEYQIIRMPGTGFCGFHCLSFCLTGNQLNYAAIIQDCINVFLNIPELFRLRTNFGVRDESSLSLNDYMSLMCEAEQKVEAGVPIDSDAWCEDAHLAAISLLCDIAIFTYSTQRKQWHVFNESGSRGYICLLNMPGHFDVLHGVDGPPVIPIAAHTECVSRDNFDTSNSVWQYLQRDYRFTFLFKFPRQFQGIHVLNNPVVLPKTKAKRMTSVSGDISAANRNKKSVNACDFPGCSYISENVKSITMHRMRCHGKKNASNTAVKGDSIARTLAITDVEAHQGCTSTDGWIKVKAKPKNNLSSEGNTSNETKKSVNRCGFPGCDYVSDKVTSIAMHKIKRHKMFSSLNITEFEDIEQRAGLSHTEVGEGCPVSKRGKYVCDVNDCGSVYYTARALAKHKRKCPLKNIQATYTMTEESDNVSLSTVHSSGCSLRRSTRISDKKTTLTADSVSEIQQAKQSKVQYEQNASGQKSREQMEPVIAESLNASKCDRSWCRGAFSNKTKRHLKNTFSDEIAELEKSFNPK